jgi:hypothetical protein
VPESVPNPIESSRIASKLRGRKSRISEAYRSSPLDRCPDKRGVGSSNLPRPTTPV